MAMIQGHAVGAFGRGVLQAVSVGSHAYRLLRSPASGRVMAVFDRSLYLALGSHWCCISSVELGKGPFNISVNLPGSIDALVVGDRVAVNDQGLNLGSHIHVSTVTASIWKPPTVPPWSIKTFVRGLDLLNQICPICCPTMGFANLLWSRPPETKRSREAQIAAPAITQLKEWLRGAINDDMCGSPPASISVLVGLGPGLTPSGDDFLAGLLIALCVAGQSPIAARIYQAVGPFLTQGTNPVSRLHLAAAAEGAGSEMLHLLLHALLVGDEDTIPKRLSAIAQVGQCSGWGGLAGMVTALQGAFLGPLSY